MAIDHLKQIMTGTVTRSNVIGIRKAYNHFERGGKPSPTAPKMTDGQLTEILLALDVVRPVAEGELHEGGLKIMRNPRYRKQLPECAIDVASFRLVGYDPICGSRWQYVPKFAACDANGAILFYFVNVPWQSGGKGPVASSR